VEGLLGDDDRRLVDVFPVAEEAREFDRRFVRLGARVAEEDFLHAGDIAQWLGQLGLALDRIDVRGVDQFGSLFLNRLHQRRVAMAERIHRDTAQRVEITLALGIEQPDAFACSKVTGQAAIGIHQRGLRHVGTDLDSCKT